MPTLLLSELGVPWDLLVGEVLHSAEGSPAEQTRI